MFGPIEELLEYLYLKITFNLNMLIIIMFLLDDNHGLVHLYWAGSLAHAHSW